MYGLHAYFQKDVAYNFKQGSNEFFLDYEQNNQYPCSKNLAFIKLTMGTTGWYAYV